MSAAPSTIPSALQSFVCPPSGADPEPVALLCGESGQGVPRWNIGDLRQASVQAGFPSPAEDFQVQRIDLMAELIKHPQASFLMRVRGESMREAGIFDGDVVLIDRAIQPRSGHVVIAVVDGEFTCKTLQMRAGRIKLKAANPTFPDIVPKDSQTVQVWGVVVAAIKQFKA